VPGRRHAIFISLETPKINLLIFWIIYFGLHQFHIFKLIDCSWLLFNKPNQPLSLTLFKCPTNIHFSILCPIEEERDSPTQDPLRAPDKSPIVYIKPRGERESKFTCVCVYVRETVGCYNVYMTYAYLIWSRITHIQTRPSTKSPLHEHLDNKCGHYIALRQW
jgi:hypothetical protein